MEKKLTSMKEQIRTFSFGRRNAAKKEETAEKILDLLDGLTSDIGYDALDIAEKAYRSRCLEVNSEILSRIAINTKD